jgi:hypothetical protein
LQGVWSRYCDEKHFCEETLPKGVGRFDYIFVENPTAEHRYYLEVSRLLRRPFPLFLDNSNHDIKGEKYLSDHLALEVTLFCSPRDQ